MKSIKTGRGPSMMGGIVSIATAIFGLIWTIIAAGIAGPLFAMFGVVFIVIAIVSAVYNFKNAFGKNRYSEFDIVDGDEEVDPLNERFGKKAYCPYCGATVGNSFTYCHKCGKKMP